VTLQPKRLYLHIGAMKTGTSYLQGMLTANAEELRSAGVLVAPDRSAAVHDVIDFGARGEAHLASVRGAWAELVETVQAFEGHSTVLSHEYFSLQGPGYVDKVVSSLGAVELHAVLTVRDATAVLPAQWQTSARNRGTLTWPEYAGAARDPGTKPRSHTFLRSQRIGKMIRIWRNRIGIENLHVVTVPRPGGRRQELWDRFAGVLGVDPGTAPVGDVPSNPSAGYATAHLLCLVHRRAAEAGLSSSGSQRLAVFVAQQAASRRAEEPTPPLDEPTRKFAAAWNREMIRVIDRSKVEVTGTLRDLPRKADLTAAQPLVPPADRGVLAAAHAAADSLLRLAPSARRPDWGSVEDAVSGLVDLMASVVDSGGADLLNVGGARRAVVSGTAPVSQRQRTRS
jgi:hypothetical protein